MGRLVVPFFLLLSLNLTMPSPSEQQLSERSEKLRAWRIRAVEAQQDVSRVGEEDDSVRGQLRISAEETDRLNFSRPEFTKEHVLQALSWKVKQAELLANTNEEYLIEVATLRAQLSACTVLEAPTPKNVAETPRTPCERGWEAIPHSKDARFALAKGGRAAPRLNGALKPEP